jgi:hypothetical protein
VADKQESKALEQIRLDLDRTLVDNVVFTAIPDKYGQLTATHDQSAMR